MRQKFFVWMCFCLGLSSIATATPLVVSLTPSIERSIRGSELAIDDSVGAELRLGIPFLSPLPSLAIGPSLGFKARSMGGSGRLGLATSEGTYTYDQYYYILGLLSRWQVSPAMGIQTQLSMATGKGELELLERQGDLAFRRSALIGLQLKQQSMELGLSYGIRAHWELLATIQLSRVQIDHRSATGREELETVRKNGMNIRRRDINELPIAAESSTMLFGAGLGLSFLF